MYWPRGFEFETNSTKSYGMGLKPKAIAYYLSHLIAQIIVDATMEIYCVVALFRAKEWSRWHCPLKHMYAVGVGLPRPPTQCLCVEWIENNPSHLHNNPIHKYCVAHAVSPVMLKSHLVRCEEYQKKICRESNVVKMECCLLYFEERGLVMITKNEECDASHERQQQNGAIDI